MANPFDYAVAFARLLWPPSDNNNEAALLAWRKAVASSVLLLAIGVGAHIALGKGLIPNFPGYASSVDLKMLQSQMQTDARQLHEKLDAFIRDSRQDRAAQIVADIVDLKIKQCALKAQGNIAASDQLLQAIEVLRAEYHEKTNRAYNPTECTEVR